MSLTDMLQHKLVSEMDTVFFSFKGNKFTAKILKGGLIGECTMHACGNTTSI